MLLYHGSKGGIVGDISPGYKASRSTCDFGKGFYLGDMPDQPKGLIMHHQEALFYEVDLDLSGLNILDLTANDSYASKIDWALFIAYNRKPELFERYGILKDRYESYNKIYDVIIGLIADDSMMRVLNQFFSMTHNDKYMLKCLSHIQLGNQYVLKSHKACNADHLKILSSRKLTDSEKKQAAEMHASRQATMNYVTDMYFKKYRHDRSARYIDEILDEWN